MNFPKKPGGGNQLQPFIPSGNGSKSGQYCSDMHNSKNYFIGVPNQRMKYNFQKSILVKNVSHVMRTDEKVSLKTKYKSNSVIKKVINGRVVTERYYNEYGVVYLDIDYTCHGNAKTHPKVPHIHIWFINEKGTIERGKWEEFK